MSNSIKTISLDNIRYVEGQVQSSSPQSPVIASSPSTTQVAPLTPVNEIIDEKTNSNNNNNTNNSLSKELINKKLESINNENLPDHLKLGKEFTFRIIILEVSDISPEYFDIFCQFNFMHRNNEAFSTEPLPNTGKGPPLGFFHIQNFTVTVTRSFIDYLKNQPILFEVLGHYHHHPLHNQALNSTSMYVSIHLNLRCIINIMFLIRYNAIRMQKTPLKYLNSPPMSKPIPAKNLNNWKNVRLALQLNHHSTYFILFIHLNISLSTNQVHSEHDLIVWYEICELEANGEYDEIIQTLYLIFII